MVYANLQGGVKWGGVQNWAHNPQVSMSLSELNTVVAEAARARVLCVAYDDTGEHIRVSKRTVAPGEDIAHLRWEQHTGNDAIFFAWHKVVRLARADAIAISEPRGPAPSFCLDLGDNAMHHAFEEVRAVAAPASGASDKTAMEGLCEAAVAEAACGNVCVYHDNAARDIIVSNNMYPKAEDVDDTGSDAAKWDAINDAWRKIQAEAWCDGVAVHEVDKGTASRRARSLVRIPVAAASEDLKRACYNGSPRPKRPASDDDAAPAKRPATEAAEPSGLAYLRKLQRASEASDKTAMRALCEAAVAEAATGNVCVYHDNNGRNIVVSNNVYPTPADAAGSVSYVAQCDAVNAAWRKITTVAGGVGVYAEMKEKATGGWCSLIRIPVALASEDLKQACTNGHPSEASDTAVTITAHTVKDNYIDYEWEPLVRAGAVGRDWAKEILTRWTPRELLDLAKEWRHGRLGDRDSIPHHLATAYLATSNPQFDDLRALFADVCTAIATYNAANPI